MTETKLIAQPQAPLRRRLHTDADYAPWVRAEQQLNDTFLFWMPVSTFPVRHEEKVWITEFLARLGSRLNQAFSLRCEVFFQYKQVTPELGDAFRKYAQTCMKLLGLGRFADSDLPSFPKPDQVKEAIDSGKPFDFRDLLGDYLIWFVSKQPEEQRRLFLGEGGMLTIYLPPDPKIRMPRLPFTPKLRAAMPLFQQVDVDGMIMGTLSMNDVFLQKSKEMFGKGLEDKPEYPGIAFILPLLNSDQFFLATPEIRTEWFNLFDVYVNESRKDRGLLLAFQKEEYEEVMLDVLQSMTLDELIYKVRT